MFMSRQVLLYHVVSGKVTSDMITNDAVVPTVEGSIHRVNVYLKSDYYDVRILPFKDLFTIAHLLTLVPPRVL